MGILKDIVYPDDGLPPDVCKACVVKLNFCDRTVSSFITADRKLRELFEIDEKSKILLEIPIIDKEQESEGHEFEMLELQNCCDVSMADDTNDSYTKELYEQKYSPTAASTDEKYAFPETKFLPAVSSSQYEIFSGDCISKCSDSMVNYDPSIKKEVYAEQICGENILKTDDFEDNSALENMYNGCNDVAFEQEVGACVEYISEETLEVSEVLEEKMNSENEDEFLDLHAVENQQEFIDVESHNLSSEACIDAKSENFFGSSVHNQLETGLEMSPILCDLCGKTFTDIYRLKCHKMIHSSDRARVCSICGKLFKNYYNMRRHMIIHTEKNFTCATCERAFYSKTLLAQHMLSHSRERPFKCDICGVAYNRQSNMLQHRKLVHVNSSFREDAQSLAYQCNKCGRRLHSELTFKAHLAKHNGGISFLQCDTCGKQYKTIELYRVHLRVHTGERPYMCEVCGKSFRGAYTLKQHSWQHRDDCRYSCPYCGRQFKQMYTLIVHKRTHTGEKPYACPICGRRFSQKNDMKKHTRTHDSKETKRVFPSDTLCLS